jgi:tetratricopeptide (TPR) repeat protein
METQELLRQAQLLFIDGKDKESVEAFTKALESGADPYIVCLSRGVVYVRMKELEPALDDFNKAISLNDNSARAYFFRGLALMMKEEFENAVSDFTNALKLKRDYFMAVFARGVSYARIGKFEEASQDMTKVMPHMEENLQSFSDSYGILRTEMWKVMAQISGEADTPALDLGEKGMETLKKWLKEE